MIDCVNLDKRLSNQFPRYSNSGQIRAFNNNTWKPAWRTIRHSKTTSTTNIYLSESSNGRRLQHTDAFLDVSCRISGRICAGSGCHVIYGPCNRISSRLLAHPDAARSQKCHHSDTDDFTQCLMNWWRHCAVPTDDDGCSWHMCYDVMTMDHATVGSVGIDAYKLSILTRKCYIHGCSARIDAFSFKTVTYNEQNKPCHIIWFLFRQLYHIKGK